MSFHLGMPAIFAASLSSRIMSVTIFAAVPIRLQYNLQLNGTTLAHLWETGKHHLGKHPVRLVKLKTVHFQGFRL